MTPFTQVTGIAAALMLSNIDTDQIIPTHALFKKTVQTSGFGSSLFYNWRYRADGSENEDFILNQRPFRESHILVTGTNFGCGSSREHAPWALRDFGIRAVIAPSFGAIFMSNCYMNGILPIVLSEAIIAAIAAEMTPLRAEMTVDLQTCVVVSPSGHRHPFRIPALQRERLLEGLDAIDAIRKREPVIARFQKDDAAKRPWVYAV